MNEELLKQIGEEFISEITSPERKFKVPPEKPSSLFIVSTIGIVGSGRTTVAQELANKLSGTVFIQSNSARYILKERHDMPWGENVRQLIKYEGDNFLSQGHGIVFDGNAADEED